MSDVEDMNPNTVAIERADFPSIPANGRRWVSLVLAVTRNSPVDPALVLAIMQSESGFDPMARSKAGACGLMQLIPRTGARAAMVYLTGRRYHVPSTALFRPHLNILLGVAYLEWLWTRRFPSIEPELLKVLLCVAAYNAGPARIRRWLADLGSVKRTALGTQPLNMGTLVATLSTALPYAETRRFVTTVARHWQHYGIYLGYMPES